MPFRSMNADVLAPWIEHAIAVFGADRCMFASNFPVDSGFGTFDDLYGTFTSIAGGLDADAREKLFAATAEKVFRL
jgi:predicted TIM-barrel fold metal-dependent hydrolase